jgi:uncharacterized protein YlbG (UPF0298 family)
MISELEAKLKLKNAEFLACSCKNRLRYNTLFAGVQELSRQVNKLKVNSVIKYVKPGPLPKRNQYSK